MRLVIFDFDETVVHLHVKWNLVHQDVITQARVMGLPVDGKMRLVQLGNALSGLGMKEAIDKIYLHHETECISKKNYEVYEDMVALVKELRARGLKLAIASGNHSDSIRSILTLIGLIDSFDLVCGRDATERNKPHPDQLLLIMEKLGIPKEETVFAGDSVHDELAARSAGVRFVKVEPGSAGSVRKAL